MPATYTTGFVVKAKTTYTDLNLINNQLFPAVLQAVGQLRVKQYDSWSHLAATVTCEFSKNVPGEFIVTVSAISNVRLDNDVWTYSNNPFISGTKGQAKQWVASQVELVPGVSQSGTNASIKDETQISYIPYTIQLASSFTYNSNFFNLIDSAFDTSMSSTGDMPVLYGAVINPTYEASPLQYNSDAPLMDVGAFFNFTTLTTSPTEAIRAANNLPTPTWPSSDNNWVTKSIYSNANQHPTDEMVCSLAVRIKNPNNYDAKEINITAGTELCRFTDAQNGIEYVYSFNTKNTLTFSYIHGSSGEYQVPILLSENGSLWSAPTTEGDRTRFTFSSTPVLV